MLRQLVQKSQQETQVQTLKENMFVIEHLECVPVATRKRPPFPLQYARIASTCHVAIVYKGLVASYSMWRAIPCVEIAGGRLRPLRNLTSSALVARGIELASTKRKRKNLRRAVGIVIYKQSGEAGDPVDRGLEETATDVGAIAPSVRFKAVNRLHQVNVETQARAVAVVLWAAQLPQPQ